MSCLTGVTVVDKAKTSFKHQTVTWDSEIQKHARHKTQTRGRQRQNQLNQLTSYYAGSARKKMTYSNVE